jgi:hypothetical protein
LTNFTLIGVLAVVLVLAGAVVLVEYSTQEESVPQEALQPIPSSNEDVFMTFVSGTEYRPGQEGQVIVEIRDKAGLSVQSNCTASVWYPDKTVFIDVENMSIVASGNSFINFTVPGIEGVYEYQANCTAKGKTAVLSKSFHVTKPRIRAEVLK